MTREGRAVWAKRVERWRDSGLTLKEFAAEIGVNANTLAGWRWRLGAEGGPAPVAVKQHGPAFLELVRAGEAGASAPTTKAEGPAVDAAPLELVLRNGHRILVPASFDGTSLLRLVDVLEAR